MSFITLHYRDTELFVRLDSITVVKQCTPVETAQLNVQCSIQVGSTTYLVTEPMEYILPRLDPSGQRFKDTTQKTITYKDDVVVHDEAESAQVRQWRQEQKVKASTKAATKKKLPAKKKASRK